MFFLHSVLIEVFSEESFRELVLNYVQLILNTYCNIVFMQYWALDLHSNLNGG